MSDNNWYCYVLISIDKRHTYIGATNNIDRRLRQHNGKIKGGAKYTRNWRPWEHLCIIGPLDKINCLRLEWRLKRCKCINSNRLRPVTGGIPKKIENIYNVLILKKWNQLSDDSLILVTFNSWKPKEQITSDLHFIEV